MDFREISHVISDTTEVDQEKLVEDIVIKLRQIGDEFDKNLTIEKELTSFMKSCVKTFVLNSIKKKLVSVTSFTDWIEWSYHVNGIHNKFCTSEDASSNEQCVAPFISVPAARVQQSKCTLRDTEPNLGVAVQNKHWCDAMENNIVTCSSGPLFLIECHTFLNCY